MIRGGATYNSLLGFSGETDVPQLEGFFLFTVNSLAKVVFSKGWLAEGKLTVGSFKTIIEHWGLSLANNLL